MIRGTGVRGLALKARWQDKAVLGEQCDMIIQCLRHSLTVQNSA